jgi:hypothetical protein
MDDSIFQVHDLWGKGLPALFKTCPESCLPRNDVVILPARGDREEESFGGCLCHSCFDTHMDGPFG